MTSTRGLEMARMMRVVMAAESIQRRMDRGDDPVELGQHLVVVVQRAVGEDVDLGAGEQLHATDRVGPESYRIAGDVLGQLHGSMRTATDVEWSVTARYS